MKSIFAHTNSKPEVTGTVVCAQRPLPGERTWQADSIGNGCYYASGDYDIYYNVWQDLDASFIVYLTNEQIVDELSNWLDRKRGLTLADVPSNISNDQLCDMAKLPHLA